MKKIMTLSEFLNKDTKCYAAYVPMALLLGDVKESIDSIKQFCDTTGEFFKGMSKIMYYSFHPKELLEMMWSALVTNSFEIFLLLCLVSTMTWLIGWEKGKKIATGSILAYGVIQAINAGLK